MAMISNSQLGHVHQHVGVCTKTTKGSYVGFVPYVSVCVFYKFLNYGKTHNLLVERSQDLILEVVQGLVRVLGDSHEGQVGSKLLIGFHPKSVQWKQFCNDSARRS